MSRTPNVSRYILRINVKSDSCMRRFCEVHLEDGNVYIFQPEKGKSTKVSYHKSGVQHVKRGKGKPILPPLCLDPTAEIGNQENPWSKSIENFEGLLPVTCELTDDDFQIDVDAVQPGTLLFVQIAIGKEFDPEEWNDGDVQQTTVAQKVFPVPLSADGLKVCARISRLRNTKRG